MNIFNINQKMLKLLIELEEEDKKTQRKELT